MLNRQVRPVDLSCFSRGRSRKSGQFFSLYLVALTLFMCGIVIWMYVVGQANAGNSLVSPVKVLEMRDKLEVLEMREVELIRDSMKGIEGEFGSDAFLDLFHKNFVEGVMDDSDIKDFVFSVSLIDGADFPKAHMDKREFFENKVYPMAKFVDGKISFSRVAMKNESVLLANDRKDKKHFPVDFSFEFEREYLISEDGSVMKR